MNEEDLENVLIEQKEIEKPLENEAPQEDDAVVKAKEKGWLPQEEFQGNPEDWVDAKTFVGADGAV